MAAGTAGKNGVARSGCDMGLTLLRVVALARTASLEGRDLAGGGPAVPPSLTAPPGGRSAALSTYVLRPVLLSRATPGQGAAAWDGCSSGSSGVICSAGRAPGLTPSPGRSWPLPAAAVPINAFADCHDIRCTVQRSVGRGGGVRVTE